MRDEDKNFGGFSVLDFRKWWRHDLFIWYSCETWHDLQTVQLKIGQSAPAKSPDSIEITRSITLSWHLFHEIVASAN